MNARRWFQPVPYAPWETLIMRILFGIAIAYAYQKIQSFPTEEVQIGIGRWLDLAFFHDPTFRTISNYTVYACLALFAWGRLCWLALPIAAFLFLGAGTLNTSQGSAQHHLQAGGMVVLVLALWYLGRAIWGRLVDARVRLERTHQLMPFLVLQVLSAAYVVAGIAKLKKSGIGWIADSQYSPVALRKTADQFYFSVTDHVEPSAVGFFDRIPELMRELLLDHPWMAMPMMGSGLLLELLAFLALVGRRSALAVGLLVMAFHYMVSQIMNLHFELNNHLLTIFFLNLPYWIWVGWRRMGNRGSAQT